MTVVHPLSAPTAEKALVVVVVVLVEGEEEDVEEELSCLLAEHCQREEEEHPEVVVLELVFATDLGVQTCWIAQFPDLHHQQQPRACKDNDRGVSSRMTPHRVHPPPTQTCRNDPCPVSHRIPQHPTRRRHHQ